MTQVATNDVNIAPTLPAASASSDAKYKARLLLASVVIVLAIIVSLVAWNNGLRDQVFPRRFGVVEQNLLYRSGQISPRLIEPTLTAHHIQVIIDLTGDEDKVEQQVQATTASNLGINYLRFPLRGDGTGDITMYAHAIQAMVEAEQAGTPALVHCSAGTQRTGGVVACYRMLVQGKSPQVALAEMKQYDWDPIKDAILVEYVNANIATLAQMLLERGVIEKLPDPLPRLPAQ